MAKKGGMPTYKTIDDYIENQKLEAQEILKELRAIIHQTLPDVEEVENTKAPNFKLNPKNKSNQQLMMAAYAKFVSFYPFPSTLEAFKDQLGDFELGKGVVKFPFNKNLPKELLQEMIRYRYQELDEE